MSAFEQFYPHLPTALQNIVISTMGYHLRRQRFGKAFREQLVELNRSERFSITQFQALQLKRLKSFVTHCYNTVPYYHYRLRQIGITPEAIQTLDELRKIPVTPKDDLRAHTAQFLSKIHAPRRLIVAHTSGTTGTPLELGFTVSDFQRRLGFLYRFLGWHGFRLGQRSARLSGRTLFPNAERTRIFWRHNAALRQLFMSSYHLKPTYLEDYVAALERFRPVLIDGYPSSVYVLARFILAKGYRGRVTPALIMTTAETLEDFQRDAIQVAFGARVVNQYASSEGAPFITECEHGSYHVNPESGIFEFVRPDTEEPAREGELAEMIVTAFDTTAYPLLRYRIGDHARFTERPCACGRAMPLVEEIIGRQEDYLFTQERGFVGRLDPVFKKSPPSIIESQIVQIEVDKIILRIVPDRSRFAETDLDVILNEMRVRLGNVAIEVEYHDVLPRGSNGKLQAVVNLVGVSREFDLAEIG